MSDFMTDMNLERLGAAKTAKNTTNKRAGSTDLNMDDFLMMMVAQFQNQDPENAASTTDMLNQMVQMSMIQAIGDVTDAVTMTYSASLVGKEVTIGSIGSDGKIQEIVGTVTGTGTYGGRPVIFVDGVTYYLSDIMAVGKLPPKTEDPGEGDGGDDGKDPPSVDNGLPSDDKNDDKVDNTLPGTPGTGEDEPPENPGGGGDTSGS